MNYNKIKYLASKKNISIAELCRKAGITDAGFYQMIPKNRMKISTLEKIAEVLEVSPAYFFDYESGYDHLKYISKKSSNELPDELLELIKILKYALTTKNELINQMNTDIERLENSLKKKKNQQTDAA